VTRRFLNFAAMMALAPPLAPAAENSLGIKILPAPLAGQAVGSKPSTVQFAAWPTRVQDFERFVAATRYDATGGALSLGADGWKARGDNWQNPGFAQGPDHPVVCVSYFDALAFCRWLTQVERESGRLPPDHCYRLPTDDEWQALVDWAYDGRKYPWSEISPGLREVKDWPPVWYHGNYAGEEVLSSGSWPQGWECATGYRDEFVGTAPVNWGGSEQWGYHDLSGNVWQWTTTAYRRELNRSELREKYRFLDRDTDDTGKPSKVIRGGCWNDYFPGLLELNTRGAREPHNRNSGLGFRIVLATGDVPND
jgi:formylglycine-generating enzyme required for sulfatase activity